MNGADFRGYGLMTSQRYLRVVQQCLRVARRFPSSKLRSLPSAKERGG